MRIIKTLINRLFKWSESEYVEDEIKTKGLKLKFMEGERLPWKGIWFMVLNVKSDSILLVPDTTTSNYAKVLGRK